jgi:hypothetical protein
MLQHFLKCWTIFSLLRLLQHFSEILQHKEILVPSTIIFNILRNVATFFRNVRFFTFSTSRGRRRAPASLLRPAAGAVTRGGTSSAQSAVAQDRGPTSSGRGGAGEVEEDDVGFVAVGALGCWLGNLPEGREIG